MPFFQRWLPPARWVEAPESAPALPQRARPEPGERILEARAARKQFGGLVAVNDLSFEMASGEILGLIGPNGAGKSTMVNLITGVLLATARVAGETAPLLFTALSNQFFSLDMTRTMANLPVTIFKFAMSPFSNWQQMAWVGVFLITVGVLVLNIAARVLFRQKH